VRPGSSSGLSPTIVFALPFFLFGKYAPWLVFLIGAPFLLKCCFAWRSLEEHALGVAQALDSGVDAGRERVKMMVSRDTAALDPDHIRSAAYESMTENLNDSIVAPLFYYAVFSLWGLGLAAAAVFRAANTMDAMLGYKDERIRLGWFSARMDDIFGLHSRPDHHGVPARVVCSKRDCLLLRGRQWSGTGRSDRDSTAVSSWPRWPGAAGSGLRNRGYTRLGTGPCSLAREGGAAILSAVRAVTLAFAATAAGTLILLAWLIL